MKNRLRVACASVFVAFIGCFASVAASQTATASPANTPPPESTSKVKRVLLYNKIGGWVTVAGIANVNQYMSSLAQSKGFELDTLSDDAGITLEFLKQYQVIVWNNNGDGARSVPTPSAREAIVEYVNQGGGWFLVGRAGDHANSWRALTDMVGAAFSRTGAAGYADMQVDSSAQKHPELRFVVHSIASTIRLNEYWTSFNRAVRTLPQTTVLYTSQNGAPNVLVPPEDGSGDRTYVWARTIEKGKLLFCPAGWAPEAIQPSPIAQADSAVAKLYWNSMRWLAGDFQNGCTNSTSPLYNAEARVDDGSCHQVNILVDRRPNKRQVLRVSDRTFLPSGIPSVKGGESSVNRDVRGRTIQRQK